MHLHRSECKLPDTIMFFFRCLYVILGVTLCCLSVMAAPSSSPLDIEADVFELDSKRNILVTSGNVQAVQGDIVLRGPYGLYNQGAQRIEFTRGVEVVRDKLRLTADQAVADAKAKRISLSGRVRLYYQGIEGESEKGAYEVSSKTVVFWGNPVVRQGQDQLTGEKIVFDSVTGRVITSGKARVKLSADRFQ